MDWVTKFICNLGVSRRFLTNRYKRDRQTETEKQRQIDRQSRRERA